jgi:hypothetical protein
MKESDYLLTLAEQLGIKEPLSISQQELMLVISENVRVLLDEENAFKSDLDAVSAYYRRWGGYIQKLATKPTKDPQHILDQIANNCHQILPDGENSVRRYTNLELDCDQ